MFGGQSCLLFRAHYEIAFLSVSDANLNAIGSVCIHYEPIAQTTTTTKNNNIININNKQPIKQNKTNTKTNKTKHTKLGAYFMGYTQYRTNLICDKTSVILHNPVGRGSFIMAFPTFLNININPTASLLRDLLTTGLTIRWRHIVYWNNGHSQRKSITQFFSSFNINHLKLIIHYFTNLDRNPLLTQI